MLENVLAAHKRAMKRIVRSRFGLDALRDFYLDMRFGAYCGWRKPSPHAQAGATNTQSTSYRHLEMLFQRAGIAITEEDVLVDIGCGKGRVINYWLNCGFRNRMIGIELDEVVARHTKRRLRQFANVTIVAGDVLHHLPPDGTVFYAFNPFDSDVMRKLKSRLVEYRLQGKNVALIYCNCCHVDIFRDDPDWDIDDLGSVGFMPAALLHLRMNKAC
jgi:hypothetical protein